MQGYTRCNTCMGAKQVMGMGIIYKDCPDCGAVGYIKNSTLQDKVMDRPSQEQIGEVVVKKRGRKKKAA